MLKGHFVLYVQPSFFPIAFATRLQRLAAAFFERQRADTRAAHLSMPLSTETRYRSFFVRRTHTYKTTIIIRSDRPIRLLGKRDSFTSLMKLTNASRTSVAGIQIRVVFHRISDVRMTRVARYIFFSSSSFPSFLFFAFLL